MADTDLPNPSSSTDPMSPAPGGGGGTAIAERPPAGPRATGIDHLTKMSTTAGLGSDNYAAYNTLAVVAVIVGVLGGLALLTDLLLVIPAAAVVCAVVALRQIGSSNGTQTGRPLAVLALLLGLGVGGYVIGGRVLHDLRTKPDRQEILSVVDQFDKAMAANDHGAAYQLTSQSFRQRFPETMWRQTFASFEAVPEYGAVSGVAWNGVPILFEEEKESRIPTAGISLLFKYRKGGEPGRVPVVFAKVDGKWWIDDIPMLFRAARPGPAGQQGTSGGQKQKERR